MIKFLIGFIAIITLIFTLASHCGHVHWHCCIIATGTPYLIGFYYGLGVSIAATLIVFLLLALIN